VSDETVREAGALCRDLGTVLHVHMAEDRADVANAGLRGWVGPLERLIRLDALPPGSILAHGVHLSSEQAREAERRGCWLVQNPRSNRGNRVGYPGALRQSRRVALGTDGWPSDPAAEGAALLEEARAHGDDLEAAARRVDAGHALLAERFGAVPTATRAAQVDIEAIRAETATEARHLWSRMAAL
jgi:cytosine/adenosine deaminase-related metal-dependent hydrolase